MSAGGVVRGVLCAAVVISTGTGSLAADSTEGDAPVAIARILSTPSVYNLDVVTLVGTIRDIRRIQVEGSCGEDSGFILYLRDETGELPIRHVGTCAEGESAPVLPGDYRQGEQVRVRAAIIEHPTTDPDRHEIEATLVRVDHLAE
ncbi:MAG: hypothetical protein AB7G48_13660 [Nitrospiraceae bacterium]